MSDQSDFIATYGPLSQDIAKQTGIQPEIVLAHLAHETGYGAHISGNGTNPFGISPGGNPATYKSLPDGAQAYVDLMKSPRYAPVTATNDPDQQAQALGALYGPNPQTAAAAHTAGGQAYGQQVSQIARQVQNQGFNAPSADDLMTRLSAKSAQDNTPDAPSADDLMNRLGTKPDQPVPAPTATPVADIESNPLTQGFLHGANEGLGNVTNPMLNKAVGFLSNLHGSKVIDNAIPALGRLDAAYTQGQSQQTKDADQAAYQQKYGDSLLAGTGNIIGEVAPTMLVGGPIGKVGAKLAAGAGPLAEKLAAGAGPLAEKLAAGAGPLARTGINLLTGATQGAVGAGMTGGNLLSGAAGGAAMGGLGAAAGGLSKTMQSGGFVSNMLHSKMADAMILGVGSMLGYKTGDWTHSVAGMGAAYAIKAAMEKGGPIAAKAAADAIIAGNKSGLLTGGAGMLTGQAGQ